MIRLISLCLLTLLVFTDCKKDDDDQDIVLTGIEDKTLLFASNQSGEFQIYQLKNGTETLLVDDPNYHYWWPKASPDRTQFLAYRSPLGQAKQYNNFDNAELMLFDIDGSNPRVLIAADANVWTEQGMARWSPDGERMIMAAKLSVDFAGNQQWRLFVTDHRGQDPAMISDRSAYDPNWSPDGSRIVFSDVPANNNSQITSLAIGLAIADFNATGQRLDNIEVLIPGGDRHQNAVFSPDGQQIAFAKGDPLFTSPNVYVLSLNSREESTVISDFRANQSIIWQEDGDHLFMQSKETAVAIRKVNLDHPEIEEIILEASDQSYDYIHPDLY